jgi:hypothetical protein
MRRLPPKYDSKTTQSEGETSDPLIADHRNFYKVEKWMKDGSKVDHMLYAGSNLNKAEAVFVAAIKHRPRIRLDYPAADASSGAVAGADAIAAVVLSVRHHLAVPAPISGGVVQRDLVS